MSRKGSIAHFYFRQGWYLEGKRPRDETVTLFPDGPGG